MVRRAFADSDISYAFWLSRAPLDTEIGIAFERPCGQRRTRLLRLFGHPLDTESKVSFARPCDQRRARPCGGRPRTMKSVTISGSCGPSWTLKTGSLSGALVARHTPARLMAPADNEISYAFWLLRAPLATEFGVAFERPRRQRRTRPRGG